MSEQASATEVKRNPLVERIGEKKVRAIAGLAIAAASLLGISGKPDAGVGVGVEVPNNILAGVMVSSSEDQYPRGLPHVSGKEYKDIDWWSVVVGGAKFTVYKAELKPDKYSTGHTVLGVYPAFETGLGKK